ncbi:3-deoxy-8-phosphooctulonate synthase [Candidatus Marinimicrobia bacterium MT.SAG.3]|nr:3-deoxy-8-phosphooctulonate synthase [Candidatus Marinimicrobia bacterium MT.SAG.3]TFB12590.1 3-deoxy-8-phosphooctulonate synthase [Candidatus Marinimicrobia bacterium MT.SAG.4]
MTKIIDIDGMKIGGGGDLLLIAGPCVIESEEIAFSTAEKLKELSDKLGLPIVYKSSYLKDNRSSSKSFQGLGLKEGLRILSEVKKRYGLPILSDVHSIEQVAAAADVLDIVQIPAYLCMQTELTIEIARRAKVVNVKKGQFIAPENIKNVIKKIEEEGNSNIILTERGVSFGYQNLVVDMRSFQIMRKHGYPVIFDVTHSVRVYGIPSKDPKGGTPEFIPTLGRAGVAAGVDGVFIETHPNPPEALCDASSQWKLDEMGALISQLQSIHAAAKEYSA